MEYDQLVEALSLIRCFQEDGGFLDLLTIQNYIKMKLRIISLWQIEYIVIFAAFVHLGVIGQGLGPDDIYTFCGKGKIKGDNSACLGICEPNKTICSPETGICSCASPTSRLKMATSNFNCKSSKPRTRCHNACKTFTMITPRFRRGETKVCENKTENKRMCFCFPK